MTELATLERQLAYSAARSDIECHCAADGPGNVWYDTENVLDDDREYIAPALRYLELRGQLERHATKPWVRVRDEQ